MRKYQGGMFYENITKKSAGLIQIQMRKMQK